MRKLIVLLMVTLLALAVSGCGKKAETDAGKVPADVKKAEAVDSTRMDSIVPDSGVVDTMVADTVGAGK